MAPNTCVWHAHLTMHRSWRCASSACTAWADAGAPTAGCGDAGAAGSAAKVTDRQRLGPPVLPFEAGTEMQNRCSAVAGVWGSLAAWRGWQGVRLEAVQHAVTESQQHRKCQAKAGQAYSAVVYRTAFGSC